PVACKLALYGVFTVPGGNDWVSIVRGPGLLTTMPNAWDAVLEALSTTWIVKSEVPTVVGVPEMVTVLVVLGDIDKPAGKVPDVMLQVKVPDAPPIALMYTV